MKYYPVFLDLRERKCLVVGGGEVAQRKVRGLVEAGARVTVVSPKLTPSLRRLVEKRKVRHVRRRYRGGDLDGYFLIYGATDHSAAHSAMAGEARSGGFLLNIVDRPELSDFIAPAVVRRGDLVLAISTGGASPALAKKLRQELEQTYGPEYARTLRFLQSLRRKLMASSLSSAERQKIFANLVRSPVIDYFKEEKTPELRALLTRIVGRRRHLSDLGIKL